MNKDNAAAFLPLVKALSEGKKIEHLALSGKWVDCSRNAAFNDPVENYRIKPAEPSHVTLDELPSVFWVTANTKPDYNWFLATAIHGDGKIQFDSPARAFSADELAAGGWFWSADRKTWNPFKKEDM